MHPPGYYKTNYRALRFRELVRMRGLAKGFSDFVVSRFMRPSRGSWMPSLWADMECKPAALSEDFQTATKPHRRDFERLGFTECGFHKLTKTLNRNIIESGGVRYLDPTRCHFGQLLRHRIRMPSRGTELNQIIIAFTAAFEHGSVSCTNTRSTFDAPRESDVIRVQSHDVAVVYQNFLQHLGKRKETPRTFPDLASLRQWFDARQIKAFEERADRRLFIPMTPQEVAAAQAQMQAGKGPPPLPSSR
jgi:hypothetical protein